jgi:hypothetical protein
MLNQAKRRRLVQLLGMLGSAHEANAPTPRGLPTSCWVNTGSLGSDHRAAHPASADATTTKPAPAARPTPETETDSWHGSTRGGWRAVARACLAGDLKLLTLWEEELLKDILHRWRGPLTERQQAIVDRIAERMGVSP